MRLAEAQFDEPFLLVRGPPRFLCERRKGNPNHLIVMLASTERLLDSASAISRPVISMDPQRHGCRRTFAQPFERQEVPDTSAPYLFERRNQESRFWCEPVGAIAREIQTTFRSNIYTADSSPFALNCIQPGSRTACPSIILCSCAGVSRLETLEASVDLNHNIIDSPD